MSTYSEQNVALIALPHRGGLRSVRQECLILGSCATATLVGGVIGATYGYPGLFVLGGVICSYLLRTCALCYRSLQILHFQERQFREWANTICESTAASVLREHFGNGVRVPTPLAVRSLLMQRAEGCDLLAEHAVVVTCGLRPACMYGAHRFVPEVLELSWRTSWAEHYLWLLAIAATFVALTWIDYIPVILPPSLLMVVTTVAAILFGLRILTRVKYVRLVPGRIEMCNYLRGTSLRTKTIDITHGAVVVVRMVDARIVVDIVKGDMEAWFTMPMHYCNENVVKKLWGALLSSVTSPSLPEDSIVGL